MIFVNGLTKIPNNCHKCPCHIDASMDGPARCTIIALIKGDSFKADPAIYKCPLIEYVENTTRGSRNDNWTVLRKRK